MLADRVHTTDPARPVAQAVAIRDGLIIAVGDRADTRGWHTAGAEVVELGNVTVTTGLVDGDIHPMLGLNVTRIRDTYYNVLHLI